MTRIVRDERPSNRQPKDIRMGIQQVDQQPFTETQKNAPRASRLRSHRCQCPQSLPPKETHIAPTDEAEDRKTRGRELMQHGKHEADDQYVRNRRSQGHTRPALPAAT